MLRPFLRRHARGRGIALGIVAVTMWLIAIIPSGIEVFALFVFVPAAAALGVFMRWVSCLFNPRAWNWATTRRAAFTSALLLPPVLAALVTLGGLQRPEYLLPLFVLGAWVALGVGLLAAAFTPSGDRDASSAPD